MTTQSLFPAAVTPEEFERVRRDEAALRPGIEALLDREGMSGRPIERFPDGSLPVYAIGGSHVLKVYPPFDLVERDRESVVMRALEGRLPVPTPEVQAVGELDGWGYVLMTRLEGELLSNAWIRVPEPARIRLAAELGEALAALHAVGDPGLPPPCGAWDQFLDAQRRSCMERQRAGGLGEEWVSQIPAFLDSTPLGGAPARSLLHTEIMREHLLVEETRDAFRLSGLFDFEPAMVGAPEYELASIGVFFSAGDPALLRTLLLAYGLGDDELSPDLARRALAYALLHRYSNLSWYLTRVPPPEGTRTLKGLAEHWYGVR